MGEPKEVGIFETKTRLSEMIEKVQQGRIFYITKRGKRVAELRPAPRKMRPLTRGCASNPGYHMAPDFDEIPADFDDYLK